MLSEEQESWNLLLANLTVSVTTDLVVKVMTGMKGKFSQGTNTVNQV